MSDNEKWYQGRDAVLNGDIPHKYKDLLPILNLVAPQRRVLDIGCNAGLVSLMALKCGAEKVVGIDKREYTINQAKLGAESWSKKKLIKRKDDISFISGDISSNLECVENSNLLIMIRSIYHLRDKIVDVMNIAKNNKDMVIITQGNPARAKKLSLETTEYGNKLIYASSISLFLKKNGFVSITLPNEIVLSKHEDSSMDLEKIKRDLEGKL